MSTMRQLNYLGTRELAWLDVPRPQLGDDASAIVRPLVVSTCDFDGAVIAGLARLRGPVPLGHEGVGIVEEAGKRVTRVHADDRVLIPWKIACGTCTLCRRGFTAQCETVGPEDAFGWGPSSAERGGFLAEAIAVPFADFMLRVVPEGADSVAVSGVADNISDGWRAVGPHLAARPGGSVLVAGKAGPGSIGLYAAGIAVALGARRVCYADNDATRLQIAKHLGTEPLAIRDGELAEMDERFDVTVDASGDPAYLAALLRLTGRGGVCTSVMGMLYRHGDVPFPVYEMYRRSVTFVTGWAHTHTIMAEPLELIASGRFDPRPVTTAVVGWDDAIAALIRPFTKLVIARER